jgi:anti-sigma-K factor RskA
MMGVDRDPQCGEDVAPYALGALPYDDAKAFERHLGDCELCRTDLASLRPAVDALPMSVDKVEPPPELRRRVMAEVEADVRRRRAAERAGRERRFAFRPLPALAAACLVLVGGIGVGTALTGEETRTIDGTAPRGATASLEVEGDSGKLVVDDMPDAPVGRVYQVWLVRGEGPPRPTDALFEVRRGGKAEVAVPGDLDEVDQVLVTHEPRGGSSVPTQTPAIGVDLASS